ncbi:hypothetical protein lerEdw1_002252 [Lerista edwardsae]|nr:hypothetical protein lerEdw1_002252 [Lerista edwardsae]
MNSYPTINSNPTINTPPPATCLNVKLSDSREQRRHTAPYIYPMGLSPPSFSSHHSSSRRSSGWVATTKLPRDYEVWSLFNFLFLNCCCMGFLALVYSIKSRDRKIVGDIEGAHHYGRKAKALNAAALIMSTFFILFALIVTAALLATRTKAISQMIGQVFQVLSKGPVRSMSNATQN